MHLAFEGLVKGAGGFSFILPPTNAPHSDLRLLTHTDVKKEVSRGSFPCQHSDIKALKDVKVHAWLKMCHMLHSHACNFFLQT